MKNSLQNIHILLLLLPFHPCCAMEQKLILPIIRLRDLVTQQLCMWAYEGTHTELFTQLCDVEEIPPELYDACCYVYEQECGIPLKRREFETLTKSIEPQELCTYETFLIPHNRWNANALLQLRAIRPTINLTLLLQRNPSTVYFLNETALVYRTTNDTAFLVHSSTFAQRLQQLGITVRNAQPLETEQVHTAASAADANLDTDKGKQSVLDVA